MKLNVSVALQHSWKKSLQVKMKPSQFVFKPYCETKQNKKFQICVMSLQHYPYLKTPSYFTINSFLCCINISVYGCLLFL